MSGPPTWIWVLGIKLGDDNKYTYLQYTDYDEAVRILRTHRALGDKVLTQTIINSGKSHSVKDGLIPPPWK